MTVSRPLEPVRTIITSVGKVAFLSAVILFAGKKAAGFIVKWLRKVMAWPATGLFGILIVAVLLVAGLAGLMGLHPFFAVFLTGIILRKYFRIRGAHLRGVITQFAMGLFTPLYFVSIGLRADFLGNFDWFLVMMIFLVACIGKNYGGGNRGVTRKNETPGRGECRFWNECPGRYGNNTCFDGSRL